MDESHFLRAPAAEPAGAAGFRRPSAFSGVQPGSPDAADGSSHSANEQAAALWRQAVHDLRGLLNVVANVTLLLQRPSSNERRVALIAVLDRNVGGLRTLLNGVADLARLDATREQPALRALDMSSVLGGLCSAFGELATSRGVRLESRGPARLLAESDALMVTRIAQNLLLNAISYTQAGGVVLTWGAYDDRWYFEIADAPYVAACAQPVEPAPAPNSVVAWTPGAGEGIGLSIVKRLCSTLGGTMQIVCNGVMRSTRIELPRHCAGSLEELTIAATEEDASRSLLVLPRGPADATREPTDERHPAVRQRTDGDLPRRQHAA